MRLLSVILITGLVFALSVVIGFVSGEESPMSLLSVSGNTSTISLEDNGTYQFIMNNVELNATTTSTNKTSLVSLEKLIKKVSGNTAIVVSGTSNNETVFMVQISNPEYSPDTKILTGIITPQVYYDGTMLSEYNEKQIDLQPGEYETTYAYIEYVMPEKENECPPPDPRYNSTCGADEY